MGVDTVEQETPPVPSCAKCGDELKANNEFTGHDNKRMCGKCWKAYLEHVRSFFKK